MSAKNPAPGQRIDPSPDFPVTWPRPQDEDLHWTRDREHMPEPITPMCYSAACAMAIESRQRTAAVYDEAIAQRYDFLFNHFIYTALVPFQGAPEALAARARRNREKVGAAALPGRQLLVARYTDATW